MLQIIAIKDIIQNPDRYRHIGDIDQLVASIREIGLLQPVVVTTDRKLVAGARRIEAHYRLERKAILCRIVDNLDEALPHLLAEMTENVCRKPFTPSEAVHAAEQLMPLAATRRDLSYIPPSLTEARIQGYGAATQKIAGIVGLSVPTLNRAAAIVEAARMDPQRLSYLVQKMDQTGKVNPAYAELCRLSNPIRSRKTASAKIRLDPNGKPKLAAAANRPLLKALLQTILYQLDATLTT